MKYYNSKLINTLCYVTGLFVCTVHTYAKVTINPSYVVVAATRLVLCVVCMYGCISRTTFLSNAPFFGPVASFTFWKNDCDITNFELFPSQFLERAIFFTFVFVRRRLFCMVTVIIVQRYASLFATAVSGCCVISEQSLNSIPYWPSSIASPCLLRLPVL